MQPRMLAGRHRCQIIWGIVHLDLVLMVDVNFRIGGVRHQSVLSRPYAIGDLFMDVPIVDEGCPDGFGFGVTDGADGFGSKQSGDLPAMSGNIVAPVLGAMSLSLVLASSGIGPRRHRLSATASADVVDPRSPHLNASVAGFPR
jgi:hypothetical protein